MELLHLIKNGNGSLKNEYVNREGWLKIADSHYFGQMSLVRSYAQKALSPGEFAQLGWPPFFPGTTKDYREIPSRIFDEQGEVKAEIREKEGYVRYAEMYTNGNMGTAHGQISSYFDVDFIIYQLQWGNQFSGSTTEFTEYEAKLFTKRGNLRKRYMGKRGYLRFTRDVQAGSMATVYMRVTTLLDTDTFQRLGWGNQQ